MYYEEAVKMFAPAFALARMFADEVGKEKALEVLNKWATAFAVRNMEQKKRSLGITGTTPKDLYDCFHAYDSQYGIWYEVDEFTPEGIEMTIKNCCMPEVCAMSGWDGEEICMKIIDPLADRVSTIISPDLKWEVVKYNPDRREGCKYRISYRRK